MELRTPRLLLRDFRPGDVEAMIALQSNPLYLTHYPGSAPTAAETRALVETFMRWAEDEPRFRYQLAITIEGRLAGNCGLRKEAVGSAEAELGCELDPRFWGRGIASEAARALIEFGTRSAGVRRIVARTEPSNRRAIALAESLGLRRTGEGIYELDLGE